MTEEVSLSMGMLGKAWKRLHPAALNLTTNQTTQHPGQAALCHSAEGPKLAGRMRSSCSFHFHSAAELNTSHCFQEKNEYDNASRKRKAVALEYVQLFGVLIYY